MPRACPLAREETPIHPDMETLLAYRDGELTAGQAVKTAEHVERCPWCRGQLCQIEIEAERLQAALTQPLAEITGLRKGSRN